jgi:Zn-dependent peptidase ImmA (M78 family)
MGLGFEPIADLWKLIREIELATLAFHGFGGDGPDGVYYWDGISGLIVVNSDKEPLVRQRFTAAHELGHHVLHRDGDAPIVIAEGDLQARADEKPIEEKEADVFAGHLLAPTEAMARAFDGKPASEISPEDVADLMHEFGTTFQTTVFRLHNSGRIIAKDRNRLFEEGGGRVNFILAAKGYDQGEIRPLHLPPEHTYNVVKMFESGVIDMPRLAELLRMDESQAAEFIANAERSEAQDEKADSLDAAFEEVFGEAESN